MEFFACTRPRSHTNIAQGRYKIALVMHEIKSNTTRRSTKRSSKTISKQKQQQQKSSKLTVSDWWFNHERIRMTWWKLHAGNSCASKIPSGSAGESSFEFWRSEQQQQNQQQHNSNVNAAGNDLHNYLLIHSLAMASPNAKSYPPLKTLKSQWRRLFGNPFFIPF